MKELLRRAPREHYWICEKVSSTLQNENVSPKIETIIAYLYNEKKLPFTLSTNEEEELFDVIKRCIEPKEAIRILKNYISIYGSISPKSRVFLKNLTNSHNISEEIFEMFRGLENADITDSITSFSDYVDFRAKELLEDIKYYLRCREMRYGKKMLYEVEKDVYFNIKSLLDIIDIEDIIQKKDFSKLFTVLKNAVKQGEENIHEVAIDFIKKTKNERQ